MNGESKDGNRSFPDPRGARAFYFTRAEYDRESGVARLGYRFDEGPELVERIVFPGAPWPAGAVGQAAFRRALNLLHAIAGVSYYKAGLSGDLVLPPMSEPGLSDFLEELYVQGLAEFGHVNGLDVAAQVRFRTVGGVPQGPERVRSLELPERALVAMGGGKDSLVALDLMRRAGVDSVPVCVGNSPLIQDTVRVAELPLLQLRRELAPGLMVMNRAGAWNGHVPVTAINSAILLCAALLYGYRFVVFANERSADEATLKTADGREINHQYSKSFAFEASLRDTISRTIGPGLEYFSILRPFSELGIVQRFSELTPFHSVFSSCNRNFHLDGPRVSDRWCRNCPKCRFAALSLALFMTPREVALIQGGALLDDLMQENGFRELCRLGREKPFECVGEAGESRAAMRALGRREAWRDHAVVRALQPDLGRVEVPALEALLQPCARHFIPDGIRARLALPEGSCADD
jgi:hypothetical protein